MIQADGWMDPLQVCHTSGLDPAIGGWVLNGKMYKSLGEITKLQSLDVLDVGRY